MADEIYHKLAKVLNKIPQGFNLTDDDTHIRVLKWIFTEEEARIAAQMKLRGETAEVMAKRLKLEVDYLAPLLETMHERGEIRQYKKQDGNHKYGLMPFVVGIYEEQIDRLDAEFAKLLEEYFAKTRYTDLFATKPEIFRVVPVNRVIEPELEIYPYQQAEAIVNNAKSWGVRDCICKKERELLGEGCNYSKNVCLTFERKENAYNEHTRSKPISREQAIQILMDAEEEGLIHNTMNVEEGHGYICNCCTCCCGVMRSLVQWDQPNALVKSDYRMTVEEGICLACGECEDRCQFGAITINEICEIDDVKCVGCGVCAITCPENALKLVLREKKELSKPPKNILSWMMKKAWKRKKSPLKVF
ncbi:MAG: hypothetical protein INQ03_12570 [Candidatus Heimdallarchaeota archaeon]|nr:hypothetical protein [Candidatus Heimdallarchaeota archaeon]